MSQFESRSAAALPTRETSKAILSDPGNIGLRFSVGEVRPENIDSPVIRNVVGELLTTAGANVNKAADPNRRTMVGLHARQLGFGENVMVVMWNAPASAKDKPTNWEPQFRAFINPKITERSDEINYDHPEGCFSVEQAISGIIPRHDSVTLEALEVDFETFLSSGEVRVTSVREHSPNKFVARILQHEVGHGLGERFPHHATEDPGALCAITDRPEFFAYRAVEASDTQPRLNGDIVAPGTRRLTLVDEADLREASVPLGRRLSPENFPTPRMALRNNLTLVDVDWFATEQADAANIAASRLNAALTLTPKTQWHEVFSGLYSHLVEWRYQLAVKRGTASSGAAAPRDAQRFLDPIADESPNVDPVGSSVGFWHNGYKWDESLGRYAGGEETPASRLVAEVGEWITARFDEEGNPGGVLQNRVRLPDGRQVNGNSLLRKEAAHEQNRIGIERARASGVDTSRFEVNGDFIYIKTGTEADRLAIRQALYDYLSQLEAAHQQGETITVQQWAEAAYLLYQSPQNKKGSDAVNRAYLMTLASRWLQPLPNMPDDIDWRAYVKGQSRFVDEIVALNSVS